MLNEGNNFWINAQEQFTLDNWMAYMLVLMSMNSDISNLLTMEASVYLLEPRGQNLVG